MKKIRYVSLLSMLLLFSSVCITNAQITLTFSFSVGTVGLAGGTNVGVNVLTQTAGSLFFALNNGRSWSAGSVQTVQRTLPGKITLNQITGIEIVTAPQSPLFTGSWDLRDFQVVATTGARSVPLISTSGKSYVKFSPNQLKKLYPVNLPVTPPSVSQSLMLDADFSRPEIPLGPVDRPTPPQYVEPQDHPGKPIPGTIAGDLYSFQTGNAAEFIVATDPATVTSNRFLRLPHLSVLSMMNLIGRRFSSTEYSRRQIQARLVFVARDLMRDDVIFILNDPAEIISGGLSDGIPNGIIRLRFQNGQIWAKTEGSTSSPRQVGTFRANVRTEVTIKLLLRPNAVVEVTVSDGSSPTVDRTVHIPARSFLPIDQVGRLAWHIMPPVYQQRPTPLQEFRLLGAYIQSY